MLKNWEIVKAFEEGKAIEWRRRGCNSTWISHVTDPGFDFGAFEYRIKPVPREFWLYVEDTSPPTITTYDVNPSDSFTEEEKANLIHVREVTDD